MLCAEAIAGLLDVSIRFSSSEENIFLKPSFCSFCLFLIAFLSAQHGIADALVTLLGGDIGSMEYRATFSGDELASFEVCPIFSALCGIVGTSAEEAFGDDSARRSVHIRIGLEQGDPSYSGLKIPE